MALAAQIDVGDLRLLLKDRAHQLDEPRVDVHHLLELVEHQHDATAAVGRDTAKCGEQLFERGIEVLRGCASIEAEGDGAVIGIDGDSWCQAQVREDLQTLLGVPQASCQLLVDRLRELRRELVLGRRAHQVHLRDEHVVLDELLGHPPNQRGLAIPARCEDHDVLPVAGVGYEAGHLGLAIRERVVKGEGAEPERVGGELRCH